MWQGTSWVLRNAFLSPSSWKYAASLWKLTVMVRFSRVWQAVLRMVIPLASGLEIGEDTMGRMRGILKTIGQGSGGYH
jgi:hypothetical protein